MLTPNDALGLMEDLGVLDAAHAGLEDAQRRAAGNRAGASVAAGLILRSQQQQIAQLKAELNALWNDRNVTACCGRANRLALQSLIGDYAKSTGQATDTIRTHMDYLRSREFDKAIVEGLQSGAITIDPRRNQPQLKEDAPWYIPEYD